MNVFIQDLLLLELQNYKSIFIVKTSFCPIYMFTSVQLTPRMVILKTIMFIITTVLITWFYSIQKRTAG